MKSNQYRTLSIWLLINILIAVSPFVLQAQLQIEREINFSKISIEKGLSQSTIYGIEQDNMGNLWIATADGLNKYDGYRFTVYRFQESDNNTIQSDYLRSLQKTTDNRLLIGSKRGLTVYDINKNSFKNYPLNQEIEYISQYSDSLYYMISPSALYEYNAEIDTLKKIDIHNKSVQFTCIKEFEKSILVGTDRGLYTLKGSRLELFRTNITAKVQDIQTTKDGLWVATEGKGLFYLKANGEIKNYLPRKGDNKSIISSYVRRLKLDSYGRLWVGTMDGLSVYNKDSDTFYNYDNNSAEEGTLSHNSIRSMFLDNQGGMWLGTYFGGLNYYHPLQNQFKKIAHIPYSNSLNNNIISCIVAGKSNDIWIGTNDEGLNRYNTLTDKFTYYTKANGLLSNNIKGILVSNDNVYVGSHAGGMAKINTKTGNIKNYTANNSEVGSNDVYSFVEDNRGLIWVATLNGLKIFDPSTEKFYALSDLDPIGSHVEEFNKELSSLQIYALYRDTRDRVWIGTNLGVYTFSTHNHLLIHYDIGSEKRHDRINCFLEDHNNKIWIGMHSGLGLLDENIQQFKVYNTNDGLPNNNVYGILQDNYKRLWISTNKGLACVTTNLEIVKLYTHKDGIQGDQFNYYAYCKLESGEMYFGGINGITHFYPEHLIANPFTPQPIISELQVYNKTILPRDNTGILESDISSSSRIKLKANQNSFSFFLTVPNYLSGQKNTFAYKLEGLDSDWTYSDDSHPITYSNLSAGSYKFYVKAANSDSKWNNTPRILEIEIIPYWWNTTIFRLAMGALLLLGGLFLMRFYRNKQKLKNELALEKLEQEKREEINQTKLRFFINISHEFRTPLTLIISPLKELLTKTTDKWSRKQLDIVIRNANKLSYLVDQLMDYRKADLGVFALKVHNGNIANQINEQIILYDRLAKQKNIELIYENTLDRDKVLYDPNYLDLILSNLLSNAFKFTPQNGVIIIKTYIKDDNLALSVSDTGLGMKDETKIRIFERFYQASNDVKGTGIGLSLVKKLIGLHHATVDVQSVYNEGTNFAIYFPQNLDIYSEEEIAQADENINRYQQISADVIDLLLDPEDDDDLTFKSDENRGDKPTILIVEDDPDVRSYLIDNLKERANIEKADNGRDGLSIVNEKSIDLVITDVMLPIMDGITLCKSIKQNIKTSHIPVIMLTAKSNPEDKFDGLIAGADSYISKPFEISILKAQVRNILHSKHRILQHYSNSLEVEPQKLTFNELDKEFLEKAKNIIEKNMDNITFSVDDFSQQIAMSRSNLHLKMKAITGESTIEFIKKIRFNEACKLLNDGRHSVSEVSVMVGFNTASYFTTSFKSYFGISPSEYIRKQKGKV